MLMNKTIVILSTLLLFTPLILSAQAARFIPAHTNVTYPSQDGTVIKGYLALPVQGENAPRGKSPAVLMIHEWWGLNEDIARLADALAAQGFVVLAPDAFRGSLATTAEAALGLTLNTPAQQISADLSGALKYLTARQDVDSERVAVHGFCFGGTQSMLLGINYQELSAVSIFYGPNLITDPERLGSLGKGGPVLGIFGDKDSNIPVDQVKAFEKALNTKKIDNTIIIYQGVGHAFVNSDNYNKGGTPQQAWDRLVLFLQDSLKE